MNFIFIKIDEVLNNLESLERVKMMRREAMSKILDKLAEVSVNVYFLG